MVGSISGIEETASHYKYNALSSNVFFYFLLNTPSICLLNTLLLFGKTGETVSFRVALRNQDTLITLLLQSDAINHAVCFTRCESHTIENNN